MKKAIVQLLVFCAVGVLVFSSCKEEKKFVPKEYPIGRCVQECVYSMVGKMADSDYNKFTADTLAETQRICEKNFLQLKCYKSEYSYFYAE